MKDVIEKNLEMMEAEERAQLELECQQDIAKCEYMKKILQIKEDRNAITIKVGGVEVSMADGFSDLVVKTLDRHIEEAQKCIDGKENGYE